MLTDACMRASEGVRCVLCQVNEASICLLTTLLKLTLPVTNTVGNKWQTRLAGPHL